MIYISLLKALLGFASWLSKYLHDKQLLQAGEYKALSEANATALTAIKAAQEARNSLDNSKNSIENDPNNRD